MKRVVIYNNCATSDEQLGEKNVLRQFKNSWYKNIVKSLLLRRAFDSDVNWKQAKQLKKSRLSKQRLISKTRNPSEERKKRKESQPGEKSLSKFQFQLGLNQMTT